MTKFKMTMNNDSKNLADLLNEAVGLRNLNVVKLAELTDIPIHYLTALLNNDFSKLPPTPYVRGYLTKLAEVLRVDADLLLKIYKEEAGLKMLRTSGPLDKLPSNRFSLKNSSRAKFFIGLVLILAVIFFVLKAGSFLGSPKIKIFSPAADNLIVRNLSINLSGEISKKDKLTINGEEVAPEESGYFQKSFSLQPGINTIEFKVKRFLGRETTVIKQIIYQP